jgi:hypothetical protein
MSADELIADWYDVKAGRRFASTAEAERNLAAYV